MKKILIISAAALVAMCACTKNEAIEGPQHEITFSVAKYVGQTKADEEKVDPADYADDYADVPFGTYAWFYGDEEGAKAQAFMEDETVSLTGDEWKPAVTYYWPKTGSIDFISYSPKSISDYVTVTTDDIKIGDAKNVYEVEDGTTVDVMYADKAVGCTENVLTYFYKGVPTLFRHALAKININIKTAYGAKVITEGEDETEWKVTVKGLALNDYLNAGYVEFPLATDGSWTLPEDKVWENDGNQVSKDFDLPTDATINSTEAKPFVSDYFVLPQELSAGQTLDVIVDIETYLPNGNTIIETGVKLTGVLGAQDVEAWEINKITSYNITIIPAASNEDGDPIEILFDPAVKDWEESDPATVTITE